MKSIIVPSPIEKLELTVGAATVVLEIDVTPDNILLISKAAAEAKPKVDAISVLEDKAKEEGDHEALRKANRDMAKAIAPVVKAGIGEEGYEAVLEAAGQGERISPARANGVVARVMAEIMASMREQGDAMSDTGDKMRDMTAVHYLAEVARADREPYPEA